MLLQIHLARYKNFRKSIATCDYKYYYNEEKQENKNKQKEWARIVAVAVYASHGKTSQSKVENQQTQRNPHVTQKSGHRPGSHWWEASALSTAERYFTRE